jgi:hypothetical protein
MYPFRVFVSYAHADRDLAQQLVETLRRLGLEAVWDRDIRPGAPFTDAIKSAITTVHVFLPLITPHSQERPWVHQETGYAMGIGVPVLPLALGNVPGEMIAQLQALTVRPDLSDIEEVLAGVNLEQVVLSPPQTVNPSVEVADFPEQRTEMVARYANRILDRGRYGQLRQRSRLCVFTVPDEDISHPIWKLRDGDTPRSSFLHQNMREERRALERHVRRAGCSLIMQPVAEQFNTTGPYSRWARLQVLQEFLKTMPDDKVRIVMTHRPPEGNLILVGDWFLSESLVPRSGQGYRQTLFNSHAPSVYDRVRKFDQEFEELYGASGLGPNESRRVALQQLGEILDSLPAPPKTP